jgi:eukaryotic-like serine/threonine-protein kinase
MRQPSVTIDSDKRQAELETVLRPGQLVGERYRVDRMIGRGGMAAVWAGINERTGKRVALKVILSSFAATAGAAELFRREIQASGRVNHPNVVNVFDVIDHEGRPCLVMEMLDGEPLSAYLARRDFLSIEEAVSFLLPAMRGVEAANAQGVVHRDLKPQNIFLCLGPDGSFVTAKILDFGISLMAERSLDATPAAVLTNTHGTPAYMSPEHIAGLPDIDERADVYGFGVLFFEALAGQLPFAGDPSPALLNRILHEPSPKLSLYRPDLRPEVTNIFDRAMAKRREDRFPTLGHFIRTLEDRLLSLSPLSRSLTPMAGVPLSELGGPRASAPAVQMIHRSEQSGPRQTETRELFTQPSQQPSPAFPDWASNDMTPEPTPGTAAMAAARRRSAKRRDWYLVAAGVSVVVSALVAWLTIPGREGQRAEISDPPASAGSTAVVPAPVPQTSPQVPVQGQAANLDRPGEHAAPPENAKAPEPATPPEPAAPPENAKPLTTDPVPVAQPSAVNVYGTDRSSARRSSRGRGKPSVEAPPADPPQSGGPAQPFLVAPSTGPSQPFEPSPPGPVQPFELARPAEPARSAGPASPTSIEPPPLAPSSPSSEVPANRAGNLTTDDF